MKSRVGVGRKGKRYRGSADERAWGVSGCGERVRGAAGTGLSWAGRGVLGRNGPFGPAGEGEVVGPAV